MVVLAGTVSAEPVQRRMPSGDEVTELRLSVPEVGKRLLPLPVAAWHATVGARVLSGIAKGDPVLVTAANVVAGAVASQRARTLPNEWARSEGRGDVRSEMVGRRNDDDDVFDLFSRGRSMLQAGHPHQAALLLSKAKLLEPEKASIREHLGRALFMAGRPARARREFAKAVHINPADDYAHFALAVACERTGQRTRALAHVKLALALRPGIRDYEGALDRLSA